LALRGLDDFGEAELEKVWEARRNESTRIAFLGLSFTSACHYNCMYCYADHSGPHPEKLTEKEVKNLIDQAHELGAKSVIICGDGEPTIDPLLMPVLSHTNSLGMRSILVTNGNLFGNDELCMDIHGIDSEELVKFLGNNNVSLIVKLETLEEELYNRIVGTDTFDQFDSGLNILFENDFGEILGRKRGREVTNMAFSTVVSKLNFLEVPHLKEYATRNNCQFICKLPSMVGSATENRKFFFDPKEKTTKWIKEDYVGHFSDKPETLTADNIHCGVWHYGCVVGENGHLRMCYTSPGEDDVFQLNVRDYPLEDILHQREEHLKEILRKGESCHIKREQYECHD